MAMVMVIVHDRGGDGDGDDDDDDADSAVCHLPPGLQTRSCLELLSNASECALNVWRWRDCGKI